MKLDKIIIKNFRSIKDSEIKFDHNCQILLGKNDAGKSNVLKAVAAVFGKYIVSASDKRKRIDNEIIDEYKIIACIKLENKDIKQLSENIKKNLQIDDNLLADKNTIANFIKVMFNEFLICINIDNNSVPELIYLDNDEKLDCFKLSDDTIHDVIKSTEIFRDKLFDQIKNYYKTSPFICHYWEYKESYLLPTTVSLQDFSANPSICEPLKNIFELCNRKNITQEFKNAMEQDGDCINLLEQVSDGVTKQFRKIWGDFNDTAIKITKDGGEILIKVVNKTNYNFADRSDGFKKLISILLMLSTRHRSGKITNRDIILIDEPDQSLYPTSARYLRDELLEIAKSANIIYTTHSQYMIDSNCIDRHIIVEKKNDITTLNKADKNAPFSNDELLKRAIGTSTFECVKEVNIIFEGWLDKLLFDNFCQFKNVKHFDNFGKTYLGGISGVETLVQLLELSNKKFIIVADSDQTSDNKRKDFEKHYPQYKNCWIPYGNILKIPIGATVEDFLDTNYIESSLKEYDSTFVYDKNKSAIKNIENVDKDKKQEIKNKLITNAKKDNIVNEYNDYIDELKKQLP